MNGTALEEKAPNKKPAHSFLTSNAGRRLRRACSVTGREALSLDSSLFSILILMIPCHLGPLNLRGSAGSAVY